VCVTGVYKVTFYVLVSRFQRSNKSSCYIAHFIFICRLLNFPELVALNIDE
jgi:hypothetical protein